MISEAKILQIEDYILNRMTPLEREVFEYELSIDIELANEVTFHKTLLQSLTEIDNNVQGGEKSAIKRYIFPYLSIAAVILTLLCFWMPWQDSVSEGFGRLGIEEDNRPFSYFVKAYSKDAHSILDTTNFYSINLEPKLDSLYYSSQFSTLIIHLSGKSQKETSDSLYLGLANFYLGEFKKSSVIFEGLINKHTDSVKELKIQEISRWYCILSYLRGSSPEKKHNRVLELIRHMMENEQPFKQSEAVKLYEKFPMSN